MPRWAAAPGRGYHDMRRSMRRAALATPRPGVCTGRFARGLPLGRRVRVGSEARASNAPGLWRRATSRHESR